MDLYISSIYLSPKPVKSRRSSRGEGKKNSEWRVPNFFNFFWGDLGFVDRYPPNFEAMLFFFFFIFFIFIFFLNLSIE